MLGFKADIKSMHGLKIAYPYCKVELINEKKEDRKDPQKTLIYYPAINY